MINFHYLCSVNIFFTEYLINVICLPLLVRVGATFLQFTENNCKNICLFANLLLTLHCN